MDEEQIKQLIESNKELQGAFTRSQQNNAELKEQITSLTDKVNQLSTSKPSSPPDNGQGSGGGGSLYDWHNAQMRTEDGQLNPDLISAMKKAGADEAVVSNIVNTIETAQNISKKWGEHAVTSTLGSMDKYEQLVEWGNQNPSPVVSAASQLLKNPETVVDGLTLLKQQAESAGFEFGQTTEPTKTNSNEPSPIPQTTSGVGGVVPLVPNTPEANKEVYEAMRSGDKARIQQVEKRLAAGARSQE